MCKKGSLYKSRQVKDALGDDTEMRLMAVVVVMSW
jgi:hypothetical protein